MTDADEPLDYIARIKNYYAALGYGAPYQWASREDIAFTKLAKPLADARIGIITTAAPFKDDAGDQGPCASYNGKAKFFEVYALASEPEPELFISHIAIDRAHTTAEDQNSYLPLQALNKLAAEGKIGSVSPRIYGLPTSRSQRTTSEKYAVDILALGREDDLDGVLLLPNCPVCHQAASLVAQHLEAGGISTVVMGCAKDIVENVGVPRLLFSDFPLGNPAGPPNDDHAQYQTASMAVELLEGADAPRTTIQSPTVWPGDSEWKKDYSNAALLSDDEIARRRAEFDRGKEEAATARTG
jgi:glycine/betaine/sarcosine/D-proline reductase family selenoprotein B